MPLRDLCDWPDCRADSEYEVYIRWTEKHANMNVWRACQEHTPALAGKLNSGEWSGGVQPVETLVSHWSGMSVHLS